MERKNIENGSSQEHMTGVHGRKEVDTMRKVSQSVSQSVKRKPPINGCQAISADRRLKLCF